MLELVINIVKNSFQIFLNNPLFLIDLIKNSSNWTLIFLVTIPLAIIIIVSFFDFIVDVWKVPFFVLLDLIKAKSIENVYLGYTATLLGTIFFYIFLKDKNKTLSKWMVGISLVLNLGFLILNENQLLIWATIPINTLLICISNVLD